MIFKHKNLSESMVMKEFEKVAIAKGMVKQAPIVKEASIISYQPSNDLLDDMLKLAGGLKSRGFDKEANSLEEKILAYKLAETHLYRAIDENAEDMLEFAHPKKNKVQFEAADGEGEVEDLLSQHKKIIDIVNKQPKKIAFEVLAETADILGLKKKADLDEVGKRVELIKYYKNQLIKFVQQKNAYYTANFITGPKELEYYSFQNGNSNLLSVGTNDYEHVLIEGYGKTWDFPNSKDVFESKFLTYFYNSNNIIAEKINDLKNGNISFAELISNDDVNHANDNLKNLYKTFYDKINNIPTLSSSSSIEEINLAINSVKSLFDENSWFIIKGLTNNDGLIENKIRSIATSLINTANELIKLVKKPEQNVSNNHVDVFDANWANMIAGRFESVADKDSDPAYFKQIASIIKSYGGKPYTELYTALVAFDNDLDVATDFHKLDLIGQKWQKHYKIASFNNEIVKKARIVPEENSEPAVKPTTYQKVNRPVQHAKPTKSNFSQTYPEEFRAVADMQIALGVLAENLSKLPIKLTPEQIKNYRNVLLGTGYGDKGEFADRVDGEWGANTQKALNVANTIFDLLGTKEKLTPEAQRVAGKSNIDSNDIAKLAKANELQINQILADKAGVDSAKEKLKTEDENSPYLDSLPKNVNFTDSDPIIDEDKTNGISLTSDDLSSFSNLFQFIRANRLVDTKNGGFNLQNWDNILNWFYVRARKQASILKTKAKAKYFVLVQNLYKKLPTENKEPNKIYSPKELDNIGNNTTHADYVTNKSNTNAEGTETQAELNKVEAPPFGYEFNISSLKKSKYGNSMEYFDQYKDWLSIPIFNVNDFSYHPKQIASKYIKALTPEDILKINGIFNPLSLIPGQTNTRYTFLDLMNSNLPAAISLRTRANDYALLSVVNGLSRDLPAIVSAYVENSPSEKYNKILTNAWDKWSNNLSSTRSRINSDFAQSGQIPKVIF